MSIINTMYTGVSGLNAEGDALGVVGDNISNSNTVGFKAQRAIFQDMLGHSVTAGTPSALPGAGVRVSQIQQMFTQGSLSNTGVSTDMALSGDGFFVVQGAVAGVTGDFYTRAGQMKIDNSGQIVNPDGMVLQGYKALPGGAFAASVSGMTVPTSALAPQATTSMTITANLNSAATIPALPGPPPVPVPFDIANPSATSNTQTTMKVYDSLGNAHSVNVYFAKTGDNTWDYHAVVEGSELQGGTPGNVEIGAGTLTFDTNGALQDAAVTAPITASFSGATANQAIAFNVGTSINAGGTGKDGVTQFAGASSVSSQSQDGYASGDLSGVSVDSNGVVQGVYTNGQKLAVGQLAIAKFSSNEGLGRAGQNLWIATRDSGDPALGTAGSGGRGAVSAGALEGSNVDLATQFVDLIAHQRAFSANSKTITTADEMLQEVVNLKR
jgi:flagellar hook protein FlgE